MGRKSRQFNKDICGMRFDKTMAIVIGMIFIFCISFFIAWGDLIVEEFTEEEEVDFLGYHIKLPTEKHYDSSYIATQSLGFFWATLFAWLFWIMFVLHHFKKNKD